MKHKGSLMEYSQEREDDLIRAFYEYIENCRHINMKEACKNIVNMPTQRFWVSDTRATIVITEMMKGTANLDKMCPTKREMYEEILRRVIDLQKDEPSKTIHELCAIIVAQTAPKFYLAPGSARMMIGKAKKKWIKRKLQKLQRLH